MPWRAGLERWLARQWWRPGLSLGAGALLPLSWLYGALAARQRAAERRTGRVRGALPVPVWVVGNVVVGGAGKTPLVLALVDALRRSGVRPGIVTRGYGRREDANSTSTREVRPQDAAADVGDEALLLSRRSGVPVWVGRDRELAARALLLAHPAVNLVLADDGLQHLRLRRALEIVVMDERGIGNGRLLPAGPLREPWPQAPRPDRTLIHSGPEAPAPRLARSLGPAWPLAAWWQGDATQAVALGELRGRPLLALAGIATPEKFFAMLESQGLDIRRLPQADHAPYPSPPWPPGTPDVVTTEKDAVKLPPAWAAEGGPRVWVLPLDSSVPADWFAALLHRFGPDAPPSGS